MGSPDRKAGSPPIDDWWCTRLENLLKNGQRLPFARLSEKGQLRLINDALDFTTDDFNRLQEQGAKQRDKEIANQVRATASEKQATEIITNYRRLSEFEIVYETSKTDCSDVEPEAETLMQILGLPSKSALLDEEMKKRVLAKLEKLGLQL